MVIAVKRKIWVVSPLMYLMAAILVVVAALDFNDNKILFATEITLAILCLLAVLIIGLHFRTHINLALRSAKKILTAEGTEELNRLPLAVTVVGTRGDIIWCNDSFIDNVSGGKAVEGETILPFIYPRTLRQVATEGKVSVSSGGKEYTVYTSKADETYILYFIDDTYFKSIHREFIEKRTVIALIAFDNREELTRDASGGDESVITAEVEAVLRSWAFDTMGGILRKLSGGRYMLISDESHMEEAKQRRFEVLDKVRLVKGHNNMSATVSIGIGRGASTTAESESWARQALDMALGRGGDQVAIMKKGDTYEFYGGLSKGIEKRDKVRTRVIAATLSDNIRSSDKVFIMGHKNSDLDSVGSAIGMWAAVTGGLKKPASIVINRQQTLARPLIDLMEANSVEKKIFISPSEAQQEITNRSLLIVVDTHSFNFVESEDVLNDIQRIVVIDHHRMMVTHIKNSIIFYHEPYASSASEMVAELIQYMENVDINPYVAQSLLAGIMLDTKNFVLKTGVRTFEASAYLKRKGADTVAAKKLFSNNFSTNKEKSLFVSTAEIYKNCAIAFSETSSGDTRVAAAQAADELLSIQGVQASFVMFPVGNEVNISGRSLGEVNVQLIMENFGGGGHLTMAGAQIKNTTVNEAYLAIKQVLDEKLEQSSQNASQNKRNNSERKEYK